MRFLPLLAPSLLMSVLAIALPARAQSRQDAAMLPAVTVHARGADEDAKDLPYTVNVIDGIALEQRRLLNVEQALRATPGVNVNSAGDGNQANIYIRGVGSLYAMSIDDSSVAMNVDGSPLPTRHISIGTLDLEQIEVLKGPQGTLFGGLGEAGAVNLTTRRPTREWEGYARAEYGQSRQFLTEAAAGGPLTGTLAGRFAIRVGGSDHWIGNVRNDQPLSKPRDLAFRGSLLWEVAARTSALISAERHRFRHLGALQLLMPYDRPPVIDVIPALLDDNEKTVERYALQLDHDFDRARLSAISAYIDSDYTALQSQDGRLLRAMGRGGNDFWRMNNIREHLFTQDLRLASLPESGVFWVTGLAYAQSTRSFDNPRNSSGSANAAYRDFDTARYGVYGEMTAPVANQLKLTVGLRQSWVRKTFDGNYHGGGAVTTDHRKLDDSFTTGRIALAYAPTPAATLYGSYGRGYNPGGFNDYAAQPLDSEPYKAAKTNSWELGFKYLSADGRYGLNGAVYLNQVRDNHLLSYDSYTYAVSALNADTRSKGAELQGTVQLDNGLGLTVGLSYIDAKIATAVNGIPDGDVKVGNRVPDVSRWSGTLGVTYRHAMPTMLSMAAPVLNARVNYQYVGKRAADPQNHFDLDSYHLLNARLGVANGRVEYYVWGSNLLNQQYDLYGYFSPPSFASGAPARGRALGGGVSYAY